MSGVGKESAMYATIHRQSADIRQVLDRDDAAIEAAATISLAKRLFLIGIGTSYHAALMGEWSFRHIGMDARAVSSFDFANYAASFPLTSDDAVVVLSHTGAKQFSLTALEAAAAAGASVISVGGEKAKHPGSGQILRTTASERSAAYTSSHTTAMTVLAQVVAALAHTRGHPHAAQMTEAIEALPGQIDSILDNEVQLESLARECVDRQTYVVGGGPSEVSALEAVIKAREAAYVRMDGMALEQFIHGPMICLQEGDPIILIHAEGAATERTTQAHQLFSSLGADVSLVGQALENADPRFSVPRTQEWLSTILTTIPMQLLAWHMATIRGLDPDTFRTQVPRFKDAIGAITL